MRLRMKKLNYLHLKHRSGPLRGASEKEGVIYRGRQCYSSIILFRLHREVALRYTKSLLGR